MARMTYMGGCIVDSVLFPCTSMDSAPEVNAQFSDHVVGLRDKSFSNSDSKGPETDADAGGGYKQIQKKIYRYSPGLIKGKFAGPISIVSDSLNVKTLIEKTIKGLPFSQIDFIYMNDIQTQGNRKGHRIKDAVAESLTININSGDVATFDIAVVAKTTEATPPFEFKSIDCSKLLTWDKCRITSTLSSDIVSFSINIKNTVIPIYTSSSDYPTSYFYPPNSLRLGMQEVTGTISSYDFSTWEKFSDVLKFKLGDDEWSLNVLYNPTQSSASGDVYVSSTSFVGQSDTAVWIKAE